MSGTLYIVATPIGNLKDITLRALEVLRGVELVLAEDTRVTRKLLSHYKVAVPLKSCHEYSSRRVYYFVVEQLREGKNIALVTDAGTPGVSDPGPHLIAYVREMLPDVSVVPIPGSSALVAALSVAGMNVDQFTFLGYPPHKKGRKSFFGKLPDINVRPVVLYESPHRFAKTLEALGGVLETGAHVIVARELTKIHEEIWQGSVAEAQKHFVGNHAKGEFVIVVP